MIFAAAAITRRQTGQMDRIHDSDNGGIDGRFLGQKRETGLFAAHPVHQLSGARSRVIRANDPLAPIPRAQPPLLACQAASRRSPGTFSGSDDLYQL